MMFSLSLIYFFPRFITRANEHIPSQRKLKILLKSKQTKISRGPECKENLKPWHSYSQIYKRLPALHSYTNFLLHERFLYFLLKCIKNWESNMPKQRLSK